MINYFKSIFFFKKQKLVSQNFDFHIKVAKLEMKVYLIVSETMITD